MRRFRRAVRSQGARRRPMWTSADQWSNGSQHMGNGNCAVSWAMWPAGFPDTSVVGDPAIAVNSTLVHTTLKGYVRIDAPANDNECWFSFGIIAWDTVNPYPLDRQFVGVGVVPDPYDGIYDWIIRTQYMHVTADGSDFAYYYPTLDTEFSSKAKRKLPQGTGLLLVASFNSPADDTNTADCRWAISARMLLKQP